MNPRLVILEGLPEAESFSLSLENGTSTTIGRGVECDLPVGSIAVSRKHCRVFVSDEGMKVEDLDSHNGTFVNDLPITSCLLNHGDRITIGNAQIMFLSMDSDENEVSAALDDGSLVANSSVSLFPQLDTAEFSPDLNTLVKLGKALNGIRDIKVLQTKFLEIILELVPARRAAILLTDDDLSDPHVVCVLAHGMDESSLMQISRTVCRRVLVEHVALLSNDLRDSHLDAAESLTISRVSSILCTPFKSGETNGLLYLDSNDVDFRFTETHLQQITALSFLVAAALSNIEVIRDLRVENAFLREGMKLETNLIGESRSMQDVFKLISKVAPSDSNVLINGESGTGKELVAQSIHLNSLRRAKPFVAINCAVLSENLLESELFGHERGAFTGAAVQKKGKLEMAEGGTVFLDEIGELIPSIQAKLLRVLQEREFERVGGGRPIKANVRVIAATNRRLEDEVQRRTFRQDLFFRLNVVQIKMPPLRERKADIPLLAGYFLKKYSEKCKRSVLGLSERSRSLLFNYDWPGNVRELENIIERAVVLGSSETIVPEDLPGELLDGATESFDGEGGFQELVRQAKRKIVSETLAAAGGSFTEAARLLGLHPNNLHRLTRNLGIEKEKP